MKEQIGVEQQRVDGTFLEEAEVLEVSESGLIGSRGMPPVHQPRSR